MVQQLATQSRTGSNREFDGTIVSVETIMGDALLVSVTAPPHVVQRLLPGQFFNIICRFPTSLDPLLRRPYSVFRVDHAASMLTFLVRPFGRGSAWLADRKPGEVIGLLEALLRFLAIKERD